MFFYLGWLVVFVFFCLFDIWKFWIIGCVDWCGDVMGVMLDDIIVGIFVGIVMMIVVGIVYGVFML